MASISFSIAKDIVLGKYPDDGITKIVTYNNVFNGGLTYAMITRKENQLRYEQSEACHNVRTLWTESKGFIVPLTEWKED